MTTATLLLSGGRTNGSPHLTSSLMRFLSSFMMFCFGGWALESYATSDLNDSANALTSIKFGQPASGQLGGNNEFLMWHCVWANCEVKVLSEYSHFIIV